MALGLLLTACDEWGTQSPKQWLQYGSLVRRSSCDHLVSNGSVRGGLDTDATSASMILFRV